MKRVPSLIAMLVIIAILLALIPKISFGPGGSGTGPTKGNGGGTGDAQGGKTSAPSARREISVKVYTDHRSGYELWVEPHGKTSLPRIALTNQPSFRRAFLEQLTKFRRELGGTEVSPRPVAQLVVPYSFSASGRTVLEELLSAAGFVVSSEQF